MSEATFSHVRISGVAAAVPERIRTLDDDAKFFGLEEVNKVSASTGVKQRHIGTSLTTADLCQAAAERLLAESGTSTEDIDALIFVSQTPDFPLPASSCCLQSRLGLPTTCAAFDVNLGCSGYVYGLWLAASLIASGAVKCALVLVGDTVPRFCSSEDRSVALLFGDAGTATLVEYHEGGPPWSFVLGTDGSGESHLKVSAGGYRMRFDADSLIRQAGEGGNRRAPSELFMDGAEIFSFTLRVVPQLVRKVLENAKTAIDNIDYFVFHQANKFMLEYLFKRLKIPTEKRVLGLENYGNTSSASIPLAMVTNLREHLQRKEANLVFAGFGVGLSWGAVNLRTNSIIVPELILVSDPAVAS